jgi:hypothetical protein
MIKSSWIFFYLFLCFQLRAQSNDSLCLNFKINFDKFPLALDKNYITANKDTIAFSAFKCYISSIEIEYADKSVFKQKNSFHLIDFEKPNTLQIPITRKSEKLISKVIFNIGIDSLTNTSGAMAGDLDPVNGMYWAWQSGYINMKIEGKSSSCPTRKNEFQFHLGGYLHPFYAIRKKVLNVNQNSNQDVTIIIDTSIFFADISLHKTNAIMIPSKIAMELSDISTKMFFIE